MANTLIEEKGVVTPDELVGTAEDFSRRIANEPGFYKTYMKAMEEGKVRQVDIGPAVPEPVVNTAVAPVVDNPDEEIDVKVKKADLGKYKNVGEVHKAAEAKQKYIEELESQIRASKTTPIVDNSVEIARLKKEAEELKAQLAKPKEEALIVDKLPNFDDLTSLSAEDLKEKIYDVETQKRMLDGINKTVEVVRANQRLEKEIVELRKMQQEMAEAQKAAIAETRQVTAQQQQALETDKTFANIGELQSKYNDLKTAKPIRAIDEEYSKFCERLCMLEKAYNEQEMTAVVNRYFKESSAEAETLRNRVKELGLEAPQEVDKYIQIREIIETAKNGKIGDRNFTLEEAYVHRNFANGGINKMVSTARADEARRTEEAVASRGQFAQVMDSAVVEPASNVSGDPEEALFIKQFERDMANRRPFSSIKQNPKDKALYDKYYAQLAGSNIDWDKF